MPDPFIAPVDVVEYLGHGGTADPNLIIATDAACDICRSIAEQPFNADTSTMTFDGSGTDAMLLPYLPVTGAGTVVVDGGTVTDYVLNRNGVLFRGTAGGGTWPRGRQNVSITFDHGYASMDLPRDVRAVALAIASRMVEQGPVMAETLGAHSVRYAVSATDLTPGELRILQAKRQIR